MKTIAAISTWFPYRKKKENIMKSDCVIVKKGHRKKHLNLDGVLYVELSCICISTLYTNHFIYLHLSSLMHSQQYFSLTVDAFCKFDRCTFNNTLGWYRRHCVFFVVVERRVVLIVSCFDYSIWISKFVYFFNWNCLFFFLFCFCNFFLKLKLI